MAEFLLSKLAESVVSQTVQRITDLLIHEGASLRSVKEDVLLLKDDLRSLWAFLKDADSKQEHDQRLRDLVLQVKDVAFDADDVIEIFILKVTSSYVKAFHNKNVRIQLSFVRNRTRGIFRRMQNCGIESVAAEGTSSTAELQRSLRRSSPNDDEDHDVISLERSTRALTAELTKEEDRLCIVSIVGMGGLGKTTLAKKVFNSVKQHFDCSAWVFISQRYVPKDVLIEIFKQADSSFENTMKFGNNKYQKQRYLQEMQEHELIGLVKAELKQKRYLVVLDDIWRIEAWDSVKRAFPKGKKGSKLLFTTRNREVATFADPLSSQIEPPFLTLEESWELLQRKAFTRDIVGDGSCPMEFIDLGKEMAQKCGGLPLAVVVLGGLLSTKNSLDEWKKVMRDVNSYLSKQESRQQYEGVHEILALSYHDLPYYLKPCFLYLGNYPEDYGIPKRKLVRLWIGEGFIMTQTEGMTAKQTFEEVAEGYLEELINRCMVQVDKRDHTGIGVKTCRMHDLMRDMCTLKARNEIFAQIIQQHESNMSINVSATSFQHSGNSHSRRLVIHPGCDLYWDTHPTCTFLVCMLPMHLG
nr:putative disease resistance protein At1g50180 [Ziziphus jujuba var. spinosa]